MRTQSAVPTHVPLPDEILLGIFEQLDDPFNVACVEIVARQWHRVARSYQHLWRDAIGIDMGRFVYEKGKNKKISPALIRRRIDALCARSGGKLDRLAIVLPIEDLAESGDVEDVEYILQLLPTLHLKELWFEGVHIADVRLSGGPPMSGHTCRPVQDLNERIPDLLVASLYRCEHLVKLHMQTYSSRFHKELARSISGTPLSSCRLQELSLKCLSVSKLFEDDAFCDMLQSATHLRLSIGNDDFPLELLSRFLQRACATIEHIDISNVAQMEQPHAPDGRPQIHLPCLKALMLGTDDFRDEDLDEEEAFPFQLLCPALAHVTLVMDHPLLFLKALLGPQGAPIETLSLRTGQDSLSKADPYIIAKLLSDFCGSTLQRLEVSDGADVLLEELARYPTMRLDTINASDSLVGMDTLVDLVRSRLCDAAYRPICDLLLPALDGFRYVEDDDERKARVEWLRRHVAHVDMLDVHQHGFRELYDGFAGEDLDIMNRRPNYFRPSQHQ